MPCLHEHAFDEQFHRDASRDGIMTAGRALYLRMPVSAFTAESRMNSHTLKSASELYLFLYASERVSLSSGR